MVDLAFRGNGSPRQARQETQSRCAVFEVPGGDLAENERMQPRLAVEEQFRQFRLAPAEVIDPNRGIYQNH
jgi:hypothetical protein